VVLTAHHVIQLDLATSKLDWQMPVRGRSLAVATPGDIVYVGGIQGLAAYDQQGRLLWVQDALPVTRVVANRDYVIGLSESLKLVVVRYDGRILGTLTPLAPIRDFAVATEGNLLVCLDEEQRLSAWELPQAE
jgi:hypothetical protein